MKKIIFLLFTAIFLATGCAALKMTPEEEAAREQYIRNAAETMQFRIDVTRMLPMSGHSRQVSGFDLTVNGDEINSYLPYFGVAYYAPYGGGNGLSFKEKISESAVYANEKGDGYVVNILVQRTDDVLFYTIDIYTNGRAYISVRSRNRQDIRYYGDVDLKYIPEN